MGLRRALVLGTCTAVTFLYAMTRHRRSTCRCRRCRARSRRRTTRSPGCSPPTSPPPRSRRRSPAGSCPASADAICAAGACSPSAPRRSLAVSRTRSSNSSLFRALQGAFGAPLAPASQAIILETYPRRQHGAVIAIFGIGSVLGPIVGPVVGGYLSETYDWRYVFYMMVPFSAAAFAGTLVLHPRPRVPAAGAARLARLPAPLGGAREPADHARPRRARRLVRLRRDRRLRGDRRDSRCTRSSCTA